MLRASNSEQNVPRFSLSTNVKQAFKNQECFKMLSAVLFGSLLTCLSIFGIIFKFSPKLLKRVFGYEVYVDIFMSFFTMAFCTMSGTLTGMLIGSSTAVLFSILLYSGARILGYERFDFKSRTWKSFPATWNIPSIRSLSFFSV